MVTAAVKTAELVSVLQEMEANGQSVVSLEIFEDGSVRPVGYNPEEQKPDSTSGYEGSIIPPCPVPKPSQD